MGNFWVIINKAISERTPFVLTPAEVKRLAQRGEKDGRVSFWLQPNSYEIDGFRDAWDRTGRGGDAA